MQTKVKVPIKNAEFAERLREIGLSSNIIDGEQTHSIGLSHGRAIWWQSTSLGHTYNAKTFEYFNEETGQYNNVILHSALLRAVRVAFEHFAWVKGELSATLYLMDRYSWGVLIVNKEKKVLKTSQDGTLIHLLADRIREGDKYDGIIWDRLLDLQLG